MTTLRRTYRIGGVLTDMDTVILNDGADAYGIKRNDTDAVIVVHDTAMTWESTGVYIHTFDDPAFNLTYDFVVQVTKGGVTFVDSGQVLGPIVATEELGSSYITVAEFQTYIYNRVTGNVVDAATDREIEAASIQASASIDQLNIVGEKLVDTQTSQFPRTGQSAVPQEVKDACCDIVIALLDGVDPEMEYENMYQISQGYANVRSTYDRKFPPIHVVAGIASITAWRKLLPYLVSRSVIRMSRVS